MDKQKHIKNINQIQKEFILKAIGDLKTLYDFENTTETEFKESYNLSKNDLIKAVSDLKIIIEDL
jgi:hypothetical protein